MGNGKSAPSGLEIDKKAVEITDFWMHYSANVPGLNPQNLSLFISEPSLHSAANFGKPSPLERAAKNFMLYRHPCILKYITSWSKGSKFYLATEEVSPLVQVISSQSALQICVGLHSILRAILFLHEKALCSHNSLTISSIYVTNEGSWRLGGLEHLCTFKNLSEDYLKKIRRTYSDEDLMLISEDSSAIDRKAFITLADQVLKLQDTEDVPGLVEFKELCSQQLKSASNSLEPSLSSLLYHPFFTHDFIKIYSFLMELPLKNDNEREEFFSNLVGQLKSFPEKVVAEQLGKLLLSRMVLLDSTAQVKLLPFVLSPKRDEDESGLFNRSTFETYLAPKLIQMFSVRDVSIRLILLSHLNSFVHAFDTDDLKGCILPELLVGVKDTDDALVSTTLRALADLVPILGAAAVIGGKRGRLFTDGRPKKLDRHPKKNDNSRRNDDSTGTIVSPALRLPERPSPDGGEDKSEDNLIFTEEENNWSDWETQEVKNQEEEEGIFEEIPVPVKSSQVEKIALPKKFIISDITELDIKHSKPSRVKDNEEIDFFAEMEPVIQKTQVLHVDAAKEFVNTNKFDMKMVNAETEDCDNGWADDLNDWADADERESNEF